MLKKHQKFRNYLSRYKEFFKFTLVGVFCAVQNIVILYLLTSTLKLNYNLGIFIQMLYVNSLGFYLNRRYTFESKNTKFWQELLRYHTTMISSFIFVCIGMFFLVKILNIWYLYAYILLTIVMLIYNFLVHKIWTFKK